MAQRDGSVIGTMSAGVALRNKVRRVMCEVDGMQRRRWTTQKNATRFCQAFARKGRGL